MEKRAILAAVLAAGLLILWQALFAPAPPPPPPAQVPAESKPAIPQAPPGGAPPPAPVPLPRRVERPPVVPQRLISVEGPLFRGTVGSDGGKLYEDRKSTRLNSSHIQKSRMPSSA